MFYVLASQKLYLDKFYSCMHGFVLAYACNLSDLKLQLLFIIQSNYSGHKFGLSNFRMQDFSTREKELMYSVSPVGLFHQ
jgi:hypothetical protein